jgi:tRNA(fMet)-specific endonuclease VapC
MAVLIDSDVIIEAERGRFDLGAWLDRYPDERFMLAAITLAELWHGAERATGSYRRTRQEFLERTFSLFEVLAYTEAMGFEHARLWARLEASGTMIGAHDLILAASALESGHAVATFNKRHFAVVQGLRLVEPR